MIKTVYVCDICGKEYAEKRYWRLSRYTSLQDDNSDGRKTMMELCDDCANEIMRRKKK